MKICIGIDASRCRSGGARAHLIGILDNLNINEIAISHVHVWTYESLKKDIPNKPWLTIHVPNCTTENIIYQLWWQLRTLPKRLHQYNCDVLFTADAASICSFSPSVTLSQDLLSFEPGNLYLYRFTKHWYRLIFIYWIKLRSLTKADGNIFLTKYAKKILQKKMSSVNDSIVISHGVDAAFKEYKNKVHSYKFNNKKIECVYISEVELYKNQIEVVKAIYLLRSKGISVNLSLVGGGAGYAKKKLENQIENFDPRSRFVALYPFLNRNELLKKLVDSDIFIFASSCETFGITLLEGMSIGMPIACSNQSSLPETLEDGGVYFNPKDPDSIANALERLINSPKLCKKISTRSNKLAEKYSWKRCSTETFTFIYDVYKRYSIGGK